MKDNTARLHPLSFALGLGVFWALILFVAGILAMYTGFARGFVTSLNSLYAYYSPNWPGCFIGAIWGFIDLFIAGYIIAVLNNFFYSKVGAAAPMPEQATQS